MTAAQRRYVAIEMAVSAVINAVLTGVFLPLVLRGRDIVPVWGSDGLVLDSVPQSLMIALMSTFVPTLLTRRRVAKGAIAGLPTTTRPPRNIVVRSIAVAVSVAVVAGAVHAVVLPLTGEAWRFATVVTFKPIYGALLGACVARFAVIAALSDR